MLPIILPLHSDHSDSSLIGNKAYSLAQVPKNIRTPTGAVVTSAALDRFIELGTAQGVQNIDEWIRTGELPEEYKSAIEALCQQYSGRVLAVRSSSSMEDGHSISAAGIFRTEIGIPSKAHHLESAIRRVWASVFSDNANLYRVKMNAGKTISMAVLIQPMVQAYSSGVAFSKHPMLGKGVLIEATVGLGIPLVDGAVTPDRFYLISQSTVKSEITPKIFAYVMTSKWLGNKAGDRITWHRGNDNYEASFLRYVTGGVAAIRLVDNRLTDTPAISKEQTEELYLSCLALEKAYKHPVDIEWAIDKVGLIILQVRPARITQILIPKDQMVGDSSGTTLQGTALSGGVVMGEVVGPSSDKYLDKILCVAELAPSDVGKLVSVKGVIVARGGILGHAAILCRELSIPCVQLKSLENIHQGDIVRIDGLHGIVNLTKDRIA